MPVPARTTGGHTSPVRFRVTAAITDLSSIAS